MQSNKPRRDTRPADPYAQPHDISDLKLAFPADLGELLPPAAVIPADYPHRQEWLRFQSNWFAGRLPADTQMHPAEGIDAQAAGRHLAAIQGSYEPKHEHKMAAVAWLASRWFTHATADGSNICPTNPDARADGS